MQTSFAPFTGQGPFAQFSGQPGIGMPQGGFGPSSQFGQFGQEFGQGGLGQPWSPMQFGQGPYGQMPPSPSLLGYGASAQQPPLNTQYLQSGLGQRQFTPFQQQLAPVQHIVTLLSQLTQHAYLQSAVVQQIGATLQQLTQLAVHALQSGQGLAGQAGQQPFGGFGGSVGQPFGQGSFGGITQAGYGGITSQMQPWGANRQQTLQ